MWFLCDSRPSESVARNFQIILPWTVGNTDSESKLPIIIGSSANLKSQIISRFCFRQSAGDRPSVVRQSAVIKKKYGHVASIVRTLKNSECVEDRALLTALTAVYRACEFIETANYR